MIPRRRIEPTPGYRGHPARKRGPSPEDVARWRDMNGLSPATSTDELLAECWCTENKMHVPRVWVLACRTWSCGEGCRG